MNMNTYVDLRRSSYFWHNMRAIFDSILGLVKYSNSFLKGEKMNWISIYDFVFMPHDLYVTHRVAHIA